MHDPQAIIASVAVTPLLLAGRMIIRGALGVVE